MDSNNDGNSIPLVVGNSNGNSMDENIPGDFILTPDDLRSLDDPVTLQQLPGNVIEKLNGAHDYFRSGHTIDHTQYDHVFITSDIHADLGMFDQLLLNAGVIEAVVNPELAHLSPLVRLISQRRWNARRTLVIIVGDIVDGRRNSNYFEVPDVKGNIELLLHAYLYNLRILADEYGSELRFTVGNHDYHSVIESPTLYGEFYRMHVHSTAQAFFVNRAGRRACLLPFYNCCPYLMLCVSTEIACVHGGFMGYNGTRLVNNTGFLRDAQEEINTAEGFEGLSPASLAELSIAERVTHLGLGYESSPLWSRRYAYGTEDQVCEELGTTYALTVVGHCQTGSGCCVNGAHTRRILSQPEYQEHNCHNDGGCVLAGCRDADGAPRLAFVDIAMSRAFNPAKNPIGRSELLYLSHDPDGPGSRYYNTIYRINAGGNQTRHELVWPLVGPARPVTGGRRFRRRSKVRRRKTRGRKNRRTRRR